MTKRILVADDDPAILDVVAMILEDAGYEVEISLDGEACLCENMSADLLLLDIRMAGKDGSAICKEVKSSERTKHIPVVIVSANSATEKIALESGADAFLLKPFEMDDLLALIAKLT